MTPEPAPSQLPEVIYIDGAVYSLFTTPLLPWLTSQTEPYDFERRTPKCQRGYIGKWKIEAGRLWLIGLYAWLNGRYTGVAALFDGQREVPADWFSGPLIIEPTASAIREGEYPRPRTLFIKGGALSENP